MKRQTCFTMWVYICCVFLATRTCVNGRVITCSTSLRHGDRILWGNNHFFRINVPKVIKKQEVKPDAQCESEKDLNKSLGIFVCEFELLTGKKENERITFKLSSCFFKEIYLFIVLRILFVYLFFSSTFFLSL